MLSDILVVKDMIPGATYKHSNGGVYVFLGRFNTYKNNCFLTGELEYKDAFYFLDTKPIFPGRERNIKSRKHAGRIPEYTYIKVWKGLPKLVQCLDEGLHPEYALAMNCLQEDVRYLSPDIYEFEKIPYTLKEFKQFITKKTLESRIYHTDINFDIFTLDGDRILCVCFGVNWEIRCKIMVMRSAEEIKEFLSEPIFSDLSFHPDYSTCGYEYAKDKILEYCFKKYNPFKLGGIKKKGSLINSKCSQTHCRKCPV